MSARIQELIEQATSAQGSTPYNPLTFEVFDKVKFAKLIARECARLAMTQHCSTGLADYGDMEPYEQGCDDTASAISGLINRAFGVEE